MSNIQPSSENVFLDLELAPAGEFLAKEELMRQIEQELEDLTLDECAQVLSLGRVEAEALFNGKISAFPIEHLSHFRSVLTAWRLDNES